MSALTIYSELKKYIKNELGIFGLMGNLKAESALLSNNLQNTSNIRLCMTDEEYTKAVDSGRYSNFSTDNAGYGLAQWTTCSRKAALLSYCINKGVSIADEQTQVEFIIKELKEKYKVVWDTINTAISIEQASNAVLTFYEAPKDQSDAVKKKRASYGVALYNQIYNIKEQNVKGKIGHASIDERNKGSGGKAGDQTGKEVYIRDWYSKPWIAVFRCTQLQMAEKIAYTMECACLNDNIGYDMSDRTTLYEEAKKYDFDLTKIDKKVECDCSSLVAVCCNAAKISVSKDMYTGNEESVLMATKLFKKLDTQKYLTTFTNLQRGDILLAKGHTAVYLGTKVMTSLPIDKPNGVYDCVVAIQKASSFNKKYSHQYETTGDLYIRDGAGSIYNILGVMKKGSRCMCYGYYTCSGEKTWLYVQAKINNTIYTGFASIKYLKEV